MTNARGLLQFLHPGLGESFMPRGFGLMLILITPLLSYAADTDEGGAEAPSAALLEFLGEMEPVDEETWRLLEHHALRDRPRQKEVTDE